MEIAAVKGPAQKNIVMRDSTLNDRVKVLALGILSSAIVLTVVQPPASIMIAAVILVVAIAVSFPSDYRKVDQAEKQLQWNRHVFIPEWQPQSVPRFDYTSAFPIAEPPREPVGKRPTFEHLTPPRSELPNQKAIPRYGNPTPIPKSEPPREPVGIRPIPTFKTPVPVRSEPTKEQEGNKVLKKIPEEEERVRVGERREAREREPVGTR